MLNKNVANFLYPKDEWKMFDDIKIIVLREEKGAAADNFDFSVSMDSYEFMISGE